MAEAGRDWQARATAGEYVFPPADASPREVLEVKPNKAADATSGPHDQIPANTYVTWTRPDGSSLIAPISNSETYERKGFKKGAEQEIPDLVEHLAKQAEKEAPRVVATKEEQASA